MTQERLMELFEYDKSAGIFIRRVAKGGQDVGSVSGSLWVDNSRANNKYIVMCVDGKSYKAHRLAWLYVYGNMPKDQIDHIDGNSLNNRISNLRDVSNMVNSMNRSLQSNNTTGYHGITMHGDRYRVRINVNGKRLSCGVYDTFEEAYKVRQAKEVEYGYHDNHGRK